MALVLNGSANTITPTSAVQPAGSILQVQHTALTTAYSQAASSGTYYDLLTQSITPASTSNKIIIHWSIGQIYADGGANQMGMILRRDTTNIAVGTSTSSRRAGTLDVTAFTDTMQHVQTASGQSGCWVDSPSSTSAITYRISLIDGDGGGTFLVNRSHDDTDDASHQRSVTQLILMEVAG